MFDADGSPTGFIEVCEDFTDLKQARTERETIRRISELFLFSRDLDDIYKKLPPLLSENFGFPIVAIELYDRQTREMVFVGSAGITLDTGAQPARVPADQTISGTVATTGRNVFELEAGKRKEYHFEILRKLEV